MAPEIHSSKTQKLTHAGYQMEDVRAVPELLHELALGLHESLASTTNTARRQNDPIANWTLYNAGRLTGPSHTPVAGRHPGPSRTST